MSTHRWTWQTADGVEAAYKLPATDGELKGQLRMLFGLRYPDPPQEKCCPGHTSPFKAMADAYFARIPTSVWLASRGFAGKSWLLAGLGLMEWLAGHDIVILGGSGEQSANVHKASKRAWDHVQVVRECPECHTLNLEHDERIGAGACETCGRPLTGAEPMEFPAPTYFLEGGNVSTGASGTSLVTRTEHVKGNIMQAIPASTKAARGPHPTRLRMDEADEMDLKIIDAALGQTMKTDPYREQQVVFASTHHYETGTMTELLKRAAEKGWPVYRWCYKETLAGPDNPDGWLLPENLEAKRAQVTSRMWRTEYDLEAPSEGETLFTKAMIDALFYPVRGGQVDDRLNEDCLFEDYVAGGKYVVAADWARKRDLSVVGVVRYDVTPPKLVRWARFFHWPWPKVVKVFNDWGKQYHAIGIHDATGIGDVVDAYLDVPKVIPYIMTPASKTKLFMDYEQGVEAEVMAWPMLKSLVEHHSYVQSDDLYGGGHPPDELVTLALAWQVAGRDLVPRKITSRIIGIRRV